MRTGTRLEAAAAALLNGKMHAAIIEKDVPELVAIFAYSEGSWLPMGEISLPDEAGRVSLSFVGDGELLVTTASGAVLRRQLQGGGVTASSTHPYGRSHAKSQWQGACGLHGAPQGLAHLRLRRSEGAQVPELFADIVASGPLFQ